jgi:deoxyadenosine/deoxycytidine kinase
MILSIDGNIGSGKSTLFNSLKNYFSEEINCNGKKIVFIDEPVNDWQKIKDKTGKNILECFYENPEKYSFSFQMLAYISRLSRLQKVVKTGEYDVIITERCVFSDMNVFAKMLYDSGNINEIEWQVYRQWFYNFLDDIPVVYFIYINTDPETCLDRINNRKRPGENISLQYLKDCDSYHKLWLENPEKHVVELDGSKDISHHSIFIERVKQLFVLNQV